MEKYLYLTEEEWAHAWIEGGEIPISLASTYLSESREGIFTPDENLIHDSTFPIPRFQEYGMGFGSVRNLTVYGNTFNGKKVPNVRNASYYKEDGLILSFCNEFDAEIARGLQKKACVKIFDINELKKVLDTQLGIKGIMKNCSYTDSFQRNHFLKSQEDSWQKEFRIFWKHNQSVWVSIPPKIGELIATYT